MCGITGIYAFNQLGRLNMINLAKATTALAPRGPDNQAHFNDDFVGLGHRRLSIIDTSVEANQPMQDITGRYILIYNGEFYNYRAVRNELVMKGDQFRTSSDSEVLLALLIREGIAGLHKVNGFFAFAFYDTATNELLIARDRYGIKPLHFYRDQDKFLFASEVKSLLAYGIDKKIDKTSLYTYLQLNYLPAPMSMLQGMQKLRPGHFLKINGESMEMQPYYKLPENIVPSTLDFNSSVSTVKETLEQAVMDRLVADVPLGTFLSGGVDSTVVSAIASRHVDGLKTFSIGYRDEPFFDETNYAAKAAKMLRTDHTVFKLTNHDLFDHLFDMLDYIDEPFADSSALAVYILGKKTRQDVTVALSGDGADELFAGYNKHAALLKMANPGTRDHFASAMAPLWQLLPKSRNSVLANKVRQLEKFTRAAKLAPQERYWFLASIGDKLYAENLMLLNEEEINMQQFGEIREECLGHLHTDSTISDNLMADLKLVLPNDMLTKVDLMSMAHGLEVRVPFLDHRVVELAFGLPEEMKITPKIRKRVVQEAFRSYMPKEIYNRPKKGFEVPLLKWFRHELRSLIEDDLLAPEFVRDQGVFNYLAVKKVKKQLFSRNPGDAHAKVWALIVFQWWWKKYFNV